MRLFSSFSAPARGLFLLLALLPAGRLARAQAPAIISLSPARNALAAPRATDLHVTFSEQLQNTAATRGAVRVHSLQRGGQLRDGAGATTTVNGNTLVLDPATDFRAGETLLVSTTTAATAGNGTSLSRGKVHQFTTAVSSAGGGYFAGGSDVAVGSFSGSVVVGDVDGDSDLDLLTVNTNSSGTVSVRLNDGSGVFGAGSDPGVGNGPQGIALGDVDGDGDLDFLTASPVLNTVSVRLGNGNGTFSGGSEVGVASGARKVAVGDFDGDGDLDFVAATRAVNTVSIRLNNGNGTFSGGSEARVSPRTDINPYDVAVGDVDNDGDLDIITANDNWLVLGVLLNGGDNSGSNTGVFTLGATPNVANSARNVSVGDLNGDGHLDLVACTIGGNAYPYICLNNGSGGFSDANNQAATFPVSVNAESVALSDMDGDGDLDIVASNSGLQQVSVMLNNGSAQFSAGSNTPISRIRYVATGDMDGNGTLDLVTASIDAANPGTASVRLNQPRPVITGFMPALGPEGTRVTVAGTGFSGATRLTLNGVVVPGFTVVSNNSLTFVVPAGATSGLLVVTTPTGTGTSSSSFTVVPEMSITAWLPGRNALAVARTANVAVTFSEPLQNTAATRGAVRVHSPQRGQLRDGARATATVSGNTLTLDPSTDFRPGETLLVSATTAATASNGGRLVLGRVQQFTAAVGSAGGGRFGGGSDPDVGTNAVSVVVGDLNGDGHLDLLAPRPDGTVGIRLNNGSGGFGGGASIAVGAGPSALALGDLDGDGDLDFVAAATTSNTVSVRLNNGNGTSFPGTTVAVGAGARSVALGDVDGDGDLDLLTANYFANTVSVRLNGGDNSGSSPGVFGGGGEVAVGSFPQSVAVGDVDNDGDLDVVTANGNSSGTASVRLNDGYGTFGGGTDPAVGSNPLSIVLGDVNGDGRLDLLTANNNSSGTVSVRTNNGSGIFGGGTDPAVGSNPQSVALGDVDGDGDLDFLTANSSSNTVSVRLNNGSGTFGGSTDPVVGSNPQSVALGDVDGDGDLDFVTANYNATTAGVRLNLPRPTISGFTPASGSVGMTVTVTGTNLGGATAVTVNGTAGTITGTPTATGLTFTVGAGSTTGLISIEAPGGTASSSSSFAVVPVPAISSFTPASGPVGTSVTVSGSGLSGATSLTVNGVSVAGFTVGGGGTTVSFVVPAGISSGPIAVTTAGGTATSSGSFTFISIASFSPTAVPSGGTITLTGSGLSGATSVTVNGVPVTGFTVGGGGTTLTFVVPAGASSGPIAVTTPGGTATSSGSLTVDNVPPTATLSTSAASPTSTSPIPFTVTFSESVTDFADNDLTIGNGTVTSGSVSGSGSTYTFTVTPASYSTVVSVSVRAGGAQDAAGNPSLASNTVSVAYNGPPPVADLINNGALVTVQAGAILFVGTGGLGNQDGTFTNAGVLHVAGPLTNPAAATLDLGAGTLEARGDLFNAGTVLPGSSAVTFSGVADQLLTPGGATLYQVLVNKATAGANTLRLAGDLTVSNSLTLTNGLVNTKNGTTVSTLRLPAAATLSGEASGRYVQGSLAITRPVGGGAAVNFGHGAVLNPAANNLGAVTITRTAGLLTDEVSRGVNFTNSALKGIDCIYTVSPTTAPSAAVQLTLTWLADNDNGLTDFSQARAWQQAAPGQPWVARSLPINANARSLTFSPTTLGRFTVSNAANPLPVTLVDFTAWAEGPAAVRLRWATASELNNAGFTVERSPDGHTFAAIGTVAGAGSSTSRHDYTLLDDHLPGGVTLLYYRLRQTDRNGAVAYSPVRTVALATATPGFGVYPTRVAAGQEATYYYTGPAAAGRLDVLNVLGQVMHTAALDGRASGPVPLAGLASGTYLLRYTGPAGRFVTRCVVD